jgi:hypothetical protein
MYYKELTLTTDPIIDFKKLIEQKTEYTYSNKNIDEFVNPKLLATLADIGLRPRFIACFGFVGQKQGTSTIHSDISYVDNSWQSVPFGINWEMTPGDMTFYWWDTHNDKEIWPDQHKPKRDIFGIHHGSVMNRDSSTYTCLDSFKPRLGIPFLARTDIAHQVIYNSDVDNRLAISLRFDNVDLPTWNSAIEKFKPFFL